eukprot:scaffold49013_cov53-Phaeocystis_antarctica.AAC.2
MTCPYWASRRVDQQLLVLGLEPLQFHPERRRVNAVLLAPLAGPLLELCRHLCHLEDGPNRGAVLVGDAAQAGVAPVLVVLLEEALQLAQRRAARGLLLVVALLHLGVHRAELLNRALLRRSHSVACQM